VRTRTRRSRSSRLAKLPDTPAVVVTGAASGIGAACCARLRAAGQWVVGIDVQESDIVADLGTPDGRRAAVAAVTEICTGGLRGLVTCAGLAGGPSRAGSLLASVNYFGTVELLRDLRPLLGPGAAAVAISSNSTTVQPGIPGELVEAFLAHDEARARTLADEAGSMATYPASKMAVAHWVRREATGTEWAGAGLRLNAIAPGLIDTPMTVAMRAEPETAPMLELFPVPVGRPGRPEEIAALVEFLLGPDGAFFCGSVLFCDGGSDALLRTTAWPAAWDISLRGLGERLS
jgi:NAD(P)-dependent dehydrogenase (short-subunit alcohol dehydrogenase family)